MKKMFIVGTVIMVLSIFILPQISSAETAETPAEAKKECKMCKGVGGFLQFLFYSDKEKDKSSAYAREQYPGRPYPG